MRQLYRRCDLEIGREVLAPVLEKVARKRTSTPLRRSRRRVEIPQVIIHEGDEPNVVTHLLGADVLASEYCAEIYFLPIEADAAACGHSDGLVVERVIDLRQASVGSHRRHVLPKGPFNRERGCRGHPQPSSRDRAAFVPGQVHHYTGAMLLAPVRTFREQILQKFCKNATIKLVLNSRRSLILLC
jgi:hypothetical protein